MDYVFGFYGPAKVSGEKPTVYFGTAIRKSAGIWKSSVKTNARYSPNAEISQWLTLGDFKPVVQFCYIGKDFKI